MKGLTKWLASRARHLNCTSFSLALTGLIAPGVVHATIYNLSDQNSTASIDGASSAGMNSWTVDGANQLNQQWFWYSFGSGANPQHDLSFITASPSTTTLGFNNLTLTYTNAQYGVKVGYVLKGDSVGSKASSMNETVRAYNFTSATQVFHLFMYSDFKLGGGTGNQTATLGTVSGVSTSVQNLGPLGIGGSNTVSAVLPTFLSTFHVEAEPANQTLTELTTISGYTLNDNATSGTTHPTWAWEWDFVLPPNTSTPISILDTLQVPELSTPTFITLGFGAWLVRLRRQYQKSR